MVNPTRRSFLTGLFASLMVPVASEAATKKSPSPKKPFKKGKVIYPAGYKKKSVIEKIIAPDEIKKLSQAYMPLCTQLEGNIPFAYQNDYPTIGCGVLFKNFEEELGKKRAIKVSLKKGCSLTLNKKAEDGSLVLNREYLEKIANVDWTKSKTRTLFPEIEKVETVQLKDCNGKYPTAKTETWEKPLFLIPKETLNAANHYAAELHINKAKEIHPNLFQLPPSLRLVVVDLIYNLGDGKYKDDFTNFKNAINQINLTLAKKECTTKNSKRRNAVRQWLIESAILANKGLSEEKIKQALRKKAISGMYPREEPILWGVIDERIKADCTWKKCQIAQNQKNHQTRIT